MSRRPGQNGTVIQHGNTWRGRWLEDVAGQSKRIRRSILLGSCDSMTKPQARRKLREFLEKQGINDVNYLIPPETPVLVFGQAADKWMKGSMTLLKPSTQRNMRSQIRKYLRPRLLNTAVDRIDSEIVRDLVIEWHSQGCGRATIRNLVGTLGLILGKQFKGVKLPKQVDARFEARWFTWEQIQQIIALSEGMCKVLFAVAAGTGMRAGELFGLRVEDVDLANSLIHVRRSVWEGNQQSPKTKNAYRKVGIDSGLVQMLAEYLGERKTGFVFQSLKGTPLREGNTVEILFTHAPWPKTARKGSGQLGPTVDGNFACSEAERSLSAARAQGGAHATEALAIHDSPAAAVLVLSKTGRSRTR
jgi:integrase